jgi:hypothetical protein
MNHAFPGRHFPGWGGRKRVKTDARGKTQGQALLRMELDLPGDLTLADLES